MAREGKGILSLRHAGYLAGLGVFGKNKLLTNDLYGNRITLGALLVDAVLEGDPVATYFLCKGMCSLCVDNCPGKALGGAKVEQKLCRRHSEGKTAKGDSLYICRLCRTICPGGKGTFQ
jgi:epoxyqueuosine reductase